MFNNCAGCSRGAVRHVVKQEGASVCAEVAEFYLEQLLRQGVSSKIEPDTTTL